MQRPVCWLGNANVDDLASLSKVFSERDAALRSLLQGKEEDLVRSENNLREFQLMKSKLISPNLDDSNQDIKEDSVEEVVVKSIIPLEIWEGWATDTLRQTLCNDCAAHTRSARSTI